MTNVRCCHLDTDGDGNCPRHMSPGTLRPRLQHQGGGGGNGRGAATVGSDDEGRIPEIGDRLASMSVEEARALSRTMKRQAE